MSCCSGPTSPLAKFMQAYSGSIAAQEKAKDKNRDGIVAPDERASPSLPAATPPGIGTAVDIAA